jgi:hypothetical protein
MVVVNPLLHWLCKTLEQQPAVADSARPVRSDLIFVGSKWFQNRLACETLIQLWSSDLPRLNIVGEVGGWVRGKFSADDLASRGIRVKGHIESLDELLRGAKAMICPMTLGSGVKVKAIDALVNGCPVIVSREAANGLEFAQRSGYVRMLDGLALPEVLRGLRDTSIDLRLFQQDLADEVVTQRRARDQALLNLV